MIDYETYYGFELNILGTGLFDAGMVQRGVKAADPLNPIDSNLAFAIAEDEDEAAAIVSSWFTWAQERLTPQQGG